MRKLTIATLVSISFISASHAQISKGSLFLGGSLIYSQSSSESNTPVAGVQPQKNTNKNWSIRPQVGTAVATNQIVGLFLNFGKGSTEQKNGSVAQLNENNNNGGGVFYRRYYPLSSRFYIFGDAALGVNFNKFETTNDNGTVRYTSAKGKGTGIDLSLTPGLSFAASRKLFLEAAFNSLLALNYGNSESTFYDPRGTVLQTSKGSSTSVGANANGFSGLSVGLRWILPRKK